MRIARKSVAGTVAVVALAVALGTTGCTTSPAPDATACTAWATATGAWATAEHSPSTSSADLAVLRSKLRDRLDSASRTATGPVKKAMAAATAGMPENALLIVEPGSTYRDAFNSNGTRVEKACETAGHAVSVPDAPTLP